MSDEAIIIEIVPQKEDSNIDSNLALDHTRESECGEELSTILTKVLKNIASNTDAKDDDIQSQSQLTCKKAVLKATAVSMAAIPGLANVPAAHAIGSATSPALGVFYTIPLSVSNWLLNLYFFDDLENDYQSAKNATSESCRIYTAHIIYFIAGIIMAGPIAGLAIIGDPTIPQWILFAFALGMTGLQYKFSVKLAVEAALHKCCIKADVVDIEALINSLSEQCNILLKKIRYESKNYSLIELDKYNSQALITKFNQSSQPNGSATIRYTPYVGAVGITVALSPFIPFMYSSLVVSYSLSNGLAIFLTTSSLVPLFILTNYFAYNNFKEIATVIVKYFREKAVPSNLEETQLQRRLKYVRRTFLVGAPTLSALSYPPIEFLFKTYVLTYFSATAQSYLLPIYFVLGIPGVTGFMITGFLRLYERLKDRLIANYANLQELQDNMIAKQSKALKSHPAKFSDDQIASLFQKLFSKINSQTQAYQNNSTGLQQEEITDNRGEYGFFKSNQSVVNIENSLPGSIDEEERSLSVSDECVFADDDQSIYTGSSPFTSQDKPSPQKKHRYCCFFAGLFTTEEQELSIFDQAVLDHDEGERLDIGSSISLSSV